MSSREPWGRLALRASVILPVLFGPPVWFFSNYTIHLDLQETPSLRAHVLIVEQNPGYRPAKGDEVAFYSRGAGPFFEDGTLMAKQVIYGPGEVVGVQDGRVVNERGEVLALLTHLRRPEVALPLDAMDRPVEPLGEDAWWVQGLTETSWDSRYWGAVHEEQIAGPVRWKFF